MSAKKTILCVDDEHSLSIQKVTLETRGYRVITCSTAAEALHIFNQRCVDLVLSTVNLPDSTAMDMTVRIKTLSPETPVILLGVPMRGIQTDAPADLVLNKGTFAPAELLERIRRLMVKRRGPRRAVPDEHMIRARA
jgi:two-component system response regulator CpxR